MNEMLTFFYNLKPINLSKVENTFEFMDNHNFFLLYPVQRSKEELMDIYQICEELKIKNIPVHTFILNRENKIISKIYDQDYILFKIEIKQYRARTS